MTGRPLRKLQRALLDELEGPLAILGFPRRVGDAFVGPFPYGSQGIIIEFAHYRSAGGDPATVDATAIAAVRYDDVDKLIDEGRDPPTPAAIALFGGDKPSRRGKDQGGFTWGTELGQTAGEGWLKFTMANPDDVALAVAGLMDSVRRLGLPWLARYTNPLIALEAMESNASPLPDVPVANVRPRLAVTLAYLYAERPRMEQVYESKRQWLTSRLSSSLNAAAELVTLDYLVAHLRSRPANAPPGTVPSAGALAWRALVGDSAR